VGEGRALACVAALLLGCGSTQEHEASICVRAETPDGEPLYDALKRLDIRAPNGKLLVGAVVRRKSLRPGSRPTRYARCPSGCPCRAM